MHADLRRLFRIFLDLHSSRTGSFGGPNAIAHAEIAAAFDLHGVRDADERRSWARMIRELDGMYLAKWIEEHPRKGGS